MADNDNNQATTVKPPMDNNSVNVINPSGELVSIDPSQLQDALASGYQQPNPEDIQKAVQTQKYGSLPQQIITGLEGAAESATLGTSTAAEVASGLTTPEAIRGRREENPIWHGIGQVGGLAATNLIPGVGEAADARAAAEAAEIAVKAGTMSAEEAAPIIKKAADTINPISASSILQGAGKAGAESVGVKEGAGFVNQVTSNAVKGAFETALFQASDELSKEFSQDPNQTAETAIVDIGLAGVMGGVFGGAFGAVAQKLKAKDNSAGIPPGGSNTPIGPEGKFVSEADRKLFEAGDLRTHIQVDPTLSEPKRASLLDAFDVSKKKPNAADILAAQKELGAPETPAMLLESPLVQMQVDTLAHSPYTYSGNRIRTLLDNAYDSAEGELNKATASTNNLSKDELGSALQKSMTGEIRSAYEPVKAAYQQVSSILPGVPITPNDVMAFKKSLQGIKEIALGNTDEGKLANQVIRVVQNAKTADDIDTIRNMASLKKSGVGYDPLGHIKGIIRDKLSAMQESAALRQADSLPKDSMSNAAISGIMAAHKAADEMYKPYIKKLSELSEWLGKSKIYGTEDAVSFMNERLSASDLANKLFSASKDPAFLRFFNKEFPNQFRLIRDYQRMALREAATTGETFSPKVFFNKFNKLEPEVQKSLYSPNEIKKINAAETYIRYAFPKNFNPSGTSHIAALREAYGAPKSMIYSNIRDFAMERFINAAGNYDAKNAVSLAKAVVKGQNLINKSVKSLFSTAAANTIEAAMPAAVSTISEPARRKLDKLVKEYSQSPEKMIDINSNNPIPEFSTAFGATAARSVQYLDSLRPKETPAAPLDQKPTASAMETAKYNRALDIAEQPLLVMNHIKKGTLSAQDVISIHTMYPKLYDKLVQEVTKNMVSSLSKNNQIPYITRLGLATFMGKPLDSSMTPQGIMSAQPQATQSPAAPPAKATKKGTTAISKLPGMYETAEEARVKRSQKN